MAQLPARSASAAYAYIVLPPMKTDLAETTVSTSATFGQCSDVT